VPLWVPEVGGPIDPHNEAHDMIMSTFGSLSKGERNRIKIRVRAAMSAQAQTQPERSLKWVSDLGIPRPA
jgi:site-specific DNA recombinase